MTEELKDKVFLVTGASRSGIGAATAALAYQRGAKVILHGRVQTPELTALAKECGDAPIILCDVTDKTAVAAAVKDALQQYGRIDALVNVAGTAGSQPFLESDDDHWHKMFDVSVLGTVHMCQEVIPHMLQQGGGRIVNVASIRGHENMASSRITAYSAAKAAIINLTSALAKEYAPTITVNCVSPGFTRTHMSKTWNDTVHAQVKTALLGRAAEPEEMAEPLLFLASDRARFITGQTLLVDGGYGIAGK